MDLQELVARIERWKERKEGGGRDVDEIIEESPVELQASQAPETLWGEHETGAEPEPALEASLGEGADALPESMDQVGVVGSDETAAEEAPIEEAHAEAAPVEEAPLEETPTPETSVEAAPVEEPLDEQPVEGAADLESEVEPLSIAPDDLIEEPPVEAAEAEEAVAIASENEPEEESADSTTEIAVEEFEEVKE